MLSDNLLVDNYGHPEANVTYIKESIPCAVDLNDPETLEINDNFNSEFSENCSCLGVCSAQEQCACVLKYGQNYIKISLTDDGKSKYLLNNENVNKLRVECSPSCSCPPFCGNRLVQHGPAENLAIIKTAEKGYGLKTNVDVQKCSFVCEYAGEVLGPNLARSRYRHNKLSKSMNYIFCLNEIVVGGKTIKTYVDPSEFGNIGRYLNHSCAPNCFITPIRVGSPVPKLCIFTARDVISGEELTFDYGSGAHQTELREAEVELTPCLCGAGNSCRKFLPCDSAES